VRAREDASLGLSAAVSHHAACRPCKSSDCSSLTHSLGDISSLAACATPARNENSLFDQAGFEQKWIPCSLLSLSAGGNWIRAHNQEDTGKLINADSDASQLLFLQPAVATGSFFSE
jgi:hypothetical protein